MILNESKRDELLIPYLKYFNQNGEQMSLGKLKTTLLAYLTEKAGLRNLSLGSNYYLAGAARYYFNGDLTVDRNVGLVSGKEDVFNTEICEKLNALIMILRNSVIDSIGQTFEQPEDFGTLSIERLLRKYGKKINKELGTGDDENAEKGDNIDRNERIGSNGYSFDIMYSHDDCKKYFDATAPGSWCITYGQQYYNTYTRRNNAHFVIFRKDGFEDIRREKGENFPLDEYGASLLAVLQGNEDPLDIPQVTSRYNHGGSGIESIPRADFVLDKEGLEALVGMTDDDLRRIYSIWEADRAKKKGSAAASETKKKNQLITREFKYKQMLLNGGSQLKDVFDSFNIITGKEEALSKSIVAARSEVQGEKYWVLVDKNRILFETVVSDANYNFSYRANGTYVPSDVYDENGQKMEGNGSAHLFNNVIFVNKDKYVMIYDTRFHRFVDIDGATKFKSVPLYTWSNIQEGSQALLYEVKQTANQMALVDIKTNKPLRLPNGETWFAYVTGPSLNRGYGRGALRANIITSDQDVLSIMYDPSMKLVYFYLPEERRFIDINYAKENGAEYAMIDPYGVHTKGYFLLELFKTQTNRYYGGETYESQETVGHQIFHGDKPITILEENGTTLIYYVYYNYATDSILCCQGKPVYGWNTNDCYGEVSCLQVYPLLPDGRRPQWNTFESAKCYLYVPSIRGLIENKVFHTPYFYLERDYAQRGWNSAFFKVFSDRQKEEYEGDSSYDKMQVRADSYKLSYLVSGAKKIGGFIPQDQLTKYWKKDSQQPQQLREEDIRAMVSESVKRILRKIK